MKDAYISTINGNAVDIAHIESLAFAGFAHFTAMQVKNKKIKGFDLHLKRLIGASDYLYNNSNDASLIREYTHQVIASGPSDKSLIITMFQQHGEFNIKGLDQKPYIYVKSSEPYNGPLGPIKLTTVSYERPFALIKHVGEVAKTYYLHHANRLGYDDSVFIDRHGRLSEGTIWNIVFWDGKKVVWPIAAYLSGTMMGIIRRQLYVLEIPQAYEEITLERLKQYKGMAIMNSWTAGVPINCLNEYQFEDSIGLIDILKKAYEAEPYLDI